MRYPIDPIPCAIGDVMPLAGGRVVFRLDPLPEDATADQAAHFARYVATLRDLGHQVVVGDHAALALVVAQEQAQ